MVLGENSDLSSFFTKPGIRLLQEGHIQTPAYITWTEIVENYSERHLTVERDKLPAFSGLASEYHRLTGHQYLAGLWKQDILFLLLWMVHPSTSSPTRRPREYRGPSWSWVSLDGPVSYHRARGIFYEFVAQVKDVSVQIAGSNLFGETQSGRISILAPIVKIQWHQKQQNPREERQQFHYRFIATTTQDCEVLPQEWSGNIFFDVTSESMLTAWCLQITTAVHLLLEPIDLNLLEFRRIGIINSEFINIQSDCTRLVTIV